MSLLTRPYSSVPSSRVRAHAAIGAGDIKSALYLSRQAVEQEPDEPEAWWVLSMAATFMWQFDEAEAALARGASLLPHASQRRAEFLCRRARLLMSIGRNTVAIQVVRDALTVPDLPAVTLGLLGGVLLRAALPEKAVEVLTQAVEIDPNWSDAWFQLGRAREVMGDLDGAETAYQSAIDTRSHTGAHLAMARLRRWTAERNPVTALLKAPAKTDGDRSRIAYALFKVYDDLDRRDEAWAALEKAHACALNEIIPTPDGAWGDDRHARSLRLAEFPHDREAANVEAWKRWFPAAYFKNSAPRASQKYASPLDNSPMYSGPRRIFIIGLPRSGTTLIERILSAHSQVQALGELNFLPIAVKRMSGIREGGLLTPDIIRRASQLPPFALVRPYNLETAYLNDGSAYTIDKLPQNYAYAGVISRTFPDAIIIHCRREPMDCLFGIFKTSFGVDYPWIYRQQDLAAHYCAYADLIEHWRSCNLGMIELSLEALISNPEVHIRNLLHACGLPFEEACMSPHKTPGAILTSSSAQARKPINADGVNAWRRYEAQLAPLREALFRSGHIDQDGKAMANR